MPKIRYSDKEIEENLSRCLAELIEDGLTTEDLQILQKGIQCLLYPLLKKHYWYLYDNE
jgi:hypothetical protein